MLARRLMAGHRSLEPAVVVRIHPGQFASIPKPLFGRASVSKSSAPVAPLWRLPHVGRAPRPFLGRLPVLAASSMALAGILLLPPESLGGLQSHPDSAQLRRQAEIAQAQFERVHRANLTRTRREWSGTCDEQYGRICLRFKGGRQWEPDEENPRVAVAREGLLEVLKDIGETLPGDHWVLGQRVRYLGYVGRWREAETLARGCSGDPSWWCSALLGYVLHRSGHTPDELEAFSHALASMDPGEARAWKDPQALVDYPVRRWLRNPVGLSREQALDRYWLLADPLYLTPGNERLAEHYARRFAATLYRGTALTLELPWGRPLEDLLLRYGFVAGWERTLPRIGKAPDGSVVERFHPESRGLLPPLEALENPSALAEGVWRPRDDRPRSSSAPVRAPLIVEGSGQVALLRRGEDLLILAAHGVPEDTLLTRRRTRVGTLPWVENWEVGGAYPLAWAPDADGRGADTLAGLFLVPAAGDAPPLSVLEVGGEGVLQLLAPPGGYLLSLELWHPSGWWGARLRHGIRGPPIPADVPSLSDPILLHGGESLPASLDEALSRMRTDANLGPPEPLTVAWEVYGLGSRREPLTFHLSLVQEETSLLRRVLARTGLVQRSPALTLSWEEGSSDHPESLFRAVDLELPPLQPGGYVLRLEMDIPYRASVHAERRITVPEQLFPAH